jgi:hypothetical protein
MAIQKQFILRYRNNGHLRFAIPEQFCDADSAQLLTAQLLNIHGVERVRVYQAQQKLSIRYQENICPFPQLAQQLFEIINLIALKKQQHIQALAVKSIQAKWNLPKRLKKSRLSRWFGEKYDESKETVEAAKILTKVGLKKNKVFLADPEKAVIDFLNDVLTLFLIRLHWDKITKEWIPQPFKYRNEWMALFYMLFLLMRSRKPKK